MEVSPVDSSSTNRPTTPIEILDVVVFVDPFEEFLKQKREGGGDKSAAPAAKSSKKPTPTTANEEDEHLTWTGKRVRGYGSQGGNDTSGSDLGVGKYLKAATNSKDGEDEIIGFVDDEPEPEPVKKKHKGMSSGGFGNFDSW